MYDELVKRLRDWPRVCTQYDGSVDQLHDEAADAIEELQKALDAVTDAHNEGYDVGYWAGRRDYEPKWIPVTERLPEHEYGESTSVLTVDLFGEMRVTYFDGGNWCWPSGEALTTLQVAPITHWMPLPVPPKGEREDDG